MTYSLKPALLAAWLVAGTAPLALAQTPPAAAPSTNCFMTKLRNSSGAFLTLTTGLSYQVLPGAGRTTAQQWLPQDKVEVCRAGGSMVEITNLSRAKPSTVRALRQ